SPSGYGWDFDVGSDIPARPSPSVYSMSKFLGLETCRLFAERFGLEVPALLFSTFIDPAVEVPRWDGAVRPDGPWPFTRSWADTGRAIRRALEVASLPRPFEMVNVNSDMPHGKFTNDKAKHVLGWEPRDRLDKFWRKPKG